MPEKRTPTSIGEETQRKRTRAETKMAEQTRDGGHEHLLSNRAKPHGGKKSAKSARRPETPTSTNEATTVPAGTTETSTHLTGGLNPSGFHPINAGLADSPINDPPLPPRDQPAQVRSTRPEEQLHIFFDLGNSRTQAGYRWGRGPLTWFDGFRGEHGCYQVPTLVTAYKSGESWVRSFGWDAKMDSEREGAVEFDRLKTNLKLDSKYLDDQIKMEEEVGLSDNWGYLMEGIIGVILDGIVSETRLPKVVCAHVGPPADWEAASYAVYLQGIRPPSKWADKFSWERAILNEGTSAARNQLTTMSAGQRVAVIDIGHGTTEMVTIRKEKHGSLVEVCRGMDIGGRQIDDFALRQLSEVFGLPLKERSIKKWIDDSFQPRYKVNPLERVDWLFEGKPLPKDTVSEIVGFMNQFYGDLAAKINDFVKGQSSKTKLVTTIVTGGVAASQMLHKKLQELGGTWNFRSNQVNDVILGRFNQFMRPAELSYERWPLSIAIPHDDNDTDIKKLGARPEKALYFARKGERMPEVIGPIIFDLEKAEGDSFEMDLSLLTTDEDLSKYRFEPSKGLNFRITPAKNSLVLGRSAVSLHLHRCTSNKATAYFFPFPQGDAICFTVIAQTDGTKDYALEKKAASRKYNYRLNGCEGEGYVRKEVTFGTGTGYEK